MDNNYKKDEVSTIGIYFLYVSLFGVLIFYNLNLSYFSVEHVEFYFYSSLCYMLTVGIFNRTINNNFLQITILIAAGCMQGLALILVFKVLSS